MKQKNKSKTKNPIHVLDFKWKQDFKTFVFLKKEKKSKKKEKKEEDEEEGGGGWRQRGEKEKGVGIGGHKGSWKKAEKMEEEWMTLKRHQIWIHSTQSVFHLFQLVFSGILLLHWMQQDELQFAHFCHSNSNLSWHQPGDTHSQCGHQYMPHGEEFVELHFLLMDQHHPTFWKMVMGDKGNNA